jgi:hypothetical protein
MLGVAVVISLRGIEGVMEGWGADGRADRHLRDIIFDVIANGNPGRQHRTEPAL